MTDPSLTDEERGRLAAEYALGVIEPGDRAVAARLLLSDRGFADLVARWEHDLAGLHGQRAPVEPPPHLWSAIAGRIHATTDTDTGTDAGAAPAPTALRWWRASSIALGLVAAALATLLAVRPVTPPTPVPAASPAPLRLAVAQLSDPAGKPLIVAGVDRATGRLRLRTAALHDGAKAPELWVIPAGGAPHSLGLVAGGALDDVQLSAVDTRYLRQGATLAVTLEPVAGAPHHAPTGEILASGPLTLL